MGKASSKFLKTEINLPLILALSVLPDIDILFSFILYHRGPTHSILMALLVFLPFFALYLKKALPYFAAFVQHALIGDYIAGGEVMLFWPLTTQVYGMIIGMRSPLNVALEGFLFIASTAIMFRTRDLDTFFQHHRSNLILVIPVFAVLFPMMFPALANFEFDVPVWLIPFHLFYLIIFSAAILIDIFEHLKFSRLKDKS